MHRGEPEQSKSQKFPKHQSIRFTSILSLAGRADLFVSKVQSTVKKRQSQNCVIYLRAYNYISINFESKIPNCRAEAGNFLPIIVDIALIVNFFCEKLNQLMQFRAQIQIHSCNSRRQKLVGWVINVQK